MKNAITTITLLLITLICFQSSAQESAVKSKKWGFEVDLVQPFIPEVNIITFKITRIIWGNPDGKHGEIMIGTYTRPFIKHDVVEKIEEYMGSIGYRHYFFKGLNIEAQYYAGYVYGEKNKIDGKNYEGFVHFIEANVGYKLNILKFNKSNIYLNPQFGYLQGLNKELIIGPRDGKADGFVQGKLQIGISF